MVIWSIIKKAGLDFWEEMLLLIIFNLFWLLGAVLILPYPFVTFALFYTVYDIGQGKGIKSAKFFNYGKQNWKAAYIWGGLNLVALFVLWINVRFYAGIETQWAFFVSLFFVSLTIFWLVMQLIVLALYPRLVEPSFKLALRNAAIIIGRHAPILLLILGLIALLLIATAFFPILAFIITFSLIAVLINSMVTVLVDRELARIEEAES